MGQDWYGDVQAFHEKFGCMIGEDGPAAPDADTAALRMRLIAEEHDELKEAHAAGDIPGVADALTDMIYVILGTSIAYGIDLRPVWDEVQRANIAKTGGGTRDDGKILKPEGWTPPDIDGVLANQGLVAS
jgi:predicted HAD superfamily Cof-like phosphohydrolase